MKIILQSYKLVRSLFTSWRFITAQRGYMSLNDAPYDKARKSENGNPYKNQIPLADGVVTGKILVLGLGEAS